MDVYNLNEVLGEEHAEKILQISGK
jgi:hypothetical protein